MAEINGTEEGEGDESGGQDRVDEPGKPGHFKRRATLPKCPGNSMRPGADAMCADAVEQCAAHGQPGTYAVWILVGPLDVAEPTLDQWTITDWKCVRERETEEERLVPVLDQSEFRRLPLPPGGAHVQPSQAPILVNMPTNVYTDTRTVVLRTTVLGQDVEVEAVPTRFVWTFGDGERLDTTDPGGAYPDMTTTHTYTATGKRQITLTTVYTGRFRVVGDSEWLPVDGTAEVPSPAVPVEVIETRAVLVP